MDFPADIAVRHLGKGVTYTRGATSTTIYAIFHRPYQSVDIGGVLVSNAAPTAHVSTADVDGSDLGAVLTVAGVAYGIIEIKDQGNGFTELVLSLESPVPGNMVNSVINSRLFPIVDTSVPLAGRDYALPSNFDDPTTYAVVGSCIVSGVDVGFSNVKGISTVRIIPNDDLADIDIIVALEA